MPAAVIVDAVRTAGGRRNGALSGWHPADLAAACLGALIERTGLDPGLVDDVVVGCVSQAGAQSVNVGRSAVLAAGWPESVPASTVDRQSASGHQAVHFAAQGVLAGAYDVVVAGGVEVMSLVPTGAAMGRGFGRPFGPRVTTRYLGAGGLVPEGIAAERVAGRFGLEREELDRYGLRSQERAAQATAEGRFSAEIVAVPARRRGGEGQVVELGGTLVADEGITAVTESSLAELRPAFEPGGRVTAGNSAQIGDGASAVLIMSEAVADRLGCRPVARFVAFAGAGDDPLLMLTGAIPATRRVLERSGLLPGAIDVVEVHEAFAPVVLAWAREIGADLETVNVNGGAIALGDPLGSSGTRELTTLVHELNRRGGRYGLLAAGGGGGVGNALVVERLS
jgi:acetyl-CoA acetyltransferase family protein